MSKDHLKVSKSYKKLQIYDPTDHGVIWKISKNNKIRGLGMERQLFVLCLLICVRAVGFYFKVGFCVF